MIKSVFPSFLFAIYFILFAIYILGHWLGNLAMISLQNHLPSIKENLLISTFTIFFVHMFCAILLNDSLNKNHHPPNIKKIYNHFLLAGLLISGFCFVVWLEHLLHLDSSPIIFSVICVIILYFLQSKLHPILERVMGTQDVIKQGVKPDNIKTLIACVSTHNADLFYDNSSDKTVNIRAKYSSWEASIGLNKGFIDTNQQVKEKLNAEKREHWNWQQLIRGIIPHKQLNRIILVGSDGDDGSQKDLETCKELLEAIVEKEQELSVVIHSTAVSFESFNQLSNELKSIILEEQKTNPTAPIALDVTGGQATASIAGAAATVDLSTQFQYVQTGGNNEVLFFNVITRNILGPHGAH